MPSKMSEIKVYSAIGRRKSSVARVSINEGNGVITINKRPIEDYFPSLAMRNTLLAPFQQIGFTAGKFDLVVSTKGGGSQGQVGAIRLAISRALIDFDKELRPALKQLGFLKRDSRVKERKKAGQPGARKNFQFSKR